MKYLVIKVKTIITKWIDPNTSKEVNATKSVELEWQGVEDVDDFSLTDDGRSWYDISTVVNIDDENTAVRNIVYHIAIPEDPEEYENETEVQNQLQQFSVLQNLVSATNDLNRAITIDDVKKARHRCYRACSIYIFSQVMSYLAACGGQPTEEGIYTAGLKPDKEHLNQLCITSEGDVYMKATMLVDNQQKVFEMTLPFVWFLYHTLVTNELPDKARNDMGLPELQLPEEDPDEAMGFMTEDGDELIDQDEVRQWLTEEETQEANNEPIQNLNEADSVENMVEPV